MNFDLTSEQYAFAEVLDRLLSRMAQEPKERTQQELHEAGVVGCLLDDEGAPPSLLTLSLAAEMLGKHLGPWAPLRAACASYVLEQNPQLGSDLSDVQREIMAGSREAVFALGSGEQRVVEGNVTQAWIFWQHGKDFELFGSRDISAEQQERADPTRQAYLVELSTEKPLARFAGVEAVRAALLILRAADSYGSANAAFNLALDYVKVRQQFGRPVGSFQAVQHQLADNLALLAPARFLNWRAAHLWPLGAGAVRQSVLAKAHVCETAVAVTRAAVELHGAIGFTEEYALSGHVKRTLDNWAAIATPGELRTEAADIAGW